MESRIRSLVKTITWRVTGSGATLAVSYAMTGNLALAGSIAGVQLITNTILYYVHERVWEGISWKKR